MKTKIAIRNAQHDISRDGAFSHKTVLVLGFGFGAESQLNQFFAEFDNLKDEFDTLKQQIQQMQQTIDDTDFTVGQLPLGAIVIMSTGIANMSTHMGYGVWQQILGGRIIMGAGVGTDLNSESRTFPIGSSGGEYRHVLTVSELPEHDHDTESDAPAVIGGKNIVNLNVLTPAKTGHRTAKTGGNAPHNNIQPYTAMAIWERIG